MYRDRVQNTLAKSDASKRLQNALLRYHDFQSALKTHADFKQAQHALSEWQINRLIGTHADLYHCEQYRKGLEFLFSDLYAPKDFSARDSDLERIFPKLIKLLPQNIIDTVAELIELNLITQTLDQDLVERLQQPLLSNTLSRETYSEAYRAGNHVAEREQQLAQVLKIGELLDRYARSSTILFSLKITRGPAEMARLSALHDFIYRGFEAFHSMRDIPQLLQTIVEREQALLASVFAGESF